jgi:hypothetical protein
MASAPARPRSRCSARRGRLEASRKSPPPRKTIARRSHLRTRRAILYTILPACALPPSMDLSGERDVMKACWLVAAAALFAPAPALAQEAGPAAENRNRHRRRPRPLLLGAHGLRPRDRQPHRPRRQRRLPELVRFGRDHRRRAHRHRSPHRLRLRPLRLDPCRDRGGLRRRPAAGHPARPRQAVARLVAGAASGRGRRRGGLCRRAL